MYWRGGPWADEKCCFKDKYISVKRKYTGVENHQVSPHISIYIRNLAFKM